MDLAQWASPAIVIAIVVLLWRQTNGRLDHVGTRIDHLADSLASVDRRLASLEGRITGWQDRQHSPAK